LPAQRLKWQEVTSPEGGFRIRMPGIPKIKQEVPPGAEDWVTIPALVLKLDNLGASFFAFHLDLRSPPENPERDLEESCTSVCESSKGHGMQTKRVALGPFPGREMRFEFSEKGRPFVQTTRIYLVRTRVIVVGVAVCKEDDPADYAQ